MSDENAYRQNLMIVANAGSGKTHALVTRCIQLLQRDAKPEEILALTFTRAAAAELSAWLASPVLLAADGAHEAELRAAAEALGAALGASAALIDSIRRRDLGPLVEAVVRRDRAVRACSAALGVC
jgi:ATP-dependent helicase/nuclease subunit A